MENHLNRKLDLLDKKQLEDKQILYYQSVDSTNLAARRLAEDGKPEYSTVVAEEQLKGRGRLGRSWFSPRGSGLWFSMILRPLKVSPSKAGAITLVTAAALAEHLNKQHGLPVMIKWPNDLLLNGKKTGGILSEMKAKPELIEYLIIGIGLNINQERADFPCDISQLATSLYIEHDKLLDRTKLLLELIEDLKKAYHSFYEYGFNHFYPLWKKYNTTLGKTITVCSPNKKIEGIAIDLTQDGSLVIRDHKGCNHLINHGEIISGKTSTDSAFRPP